MSNDAKSDSQLSEILEQNHTIAVVGIKDREGEDAYRIPKYMQEHGYTIVPINPKLDRVLGEEARASLRELSDTNLEIDLVNLFRATDHLSAHVDEILEMSPRPKTVWMQLGIHHGASATRLRAAGIKVVQDRCIMVDHRRLLDVGDGGQSAATRRSAAGARSATGDDPA
jgi:predicted CoA-binding protein